MHAAKKRLLVALGSLVLLAALLPGGPAAAGPVEEAPVTVSPSLQVSPELSEFRPGVPAELTAQISHTVAEALPVHFEIAFVNYRPHFGRQRSHYSDQQCVIPVARLTCSLKFNSQDQSVAVVRAWLGGQSAAPPDRSEGRLSSLALYPHPGADCRLEDGEPVDDSCRGGLNSYVEPGEPEPDATDVVLVGWTGTANAFFDCDDLNGDTEVEVRRPSDRTVTYVCEAHNRQTGEPIVGAHVAGEIMGGPFDDDSNGRAHSDYGDYDDAGRRLCRTTAPAGRCRFDFTVPKEGPGQVVLCLWTDGENDGYFGPSETDGGGCATEAVDEPEGFDGTDTVRIELRE